MTKDPNLPPNARERAGRTTQPTTTRSGSNGWMIALAVLAIVVIGAFFLWPDRTSNVAGRDPVTTGATTERTTPAPAPTNPATSNAPTPASPAPPQ